MTSILEQHIAYTAGKWTDRLFVESRSERRKRQLIYFSPLERRWRDPVEDENRFVERDIEKPRRVEGNIHVKPLSASGVSFDETLANGHSRRNPQRIVTLVTNGVRYRAIEGQRPKLYSDIPSSPQAIVAAVERSRIRRQPQPPTPRGLSTLHGDTESNHDAIPTRAP